MPGDVGQGDLHGVAGGVLLHSHQAGHAFPGHIGGADGVAGALRSGHEHIYALGGDDLLIADVEAVGKGQGVAVLQIGGDVSLIHIGLDLVVDEHHHDVAPLGSLRHGHDFQAVLLRHGPVLGAGAQADAHVTAGILQVQGMGMALGAVADDGDLLSIEIVDVTVFCVIHLCHCNALLLV